MNRPQAHEYPAWGANYINQVDGDVLELLEAQAGTFPDFINTLVEKAAYAYAPGKWTIKELIGHMIDTERVLVFRLMSFVRGEKAELPGFDEDGYVEQAHFMDRSLFSMADEFSLLRRANLHLIRSLDEVELARSGKANGKEMTARALVFIIAGHVVHHVRIIKERYL